jgi:putative transcriptional regulator
LRSTEVTGSPRPRTWARLGFALAPLTILLTVLLTVLLSARSHGAVPPRLSPKDLATGRMLIATRQVSGPVFGRSVVLLTEHADTLGAVGLILNRRSTLPLDAVVANLGGAKLAKSPIHLGGPVSPETLRIAWRSSETPKGAVRVLGDLHTSSHVSVLEHLIDADTAADEVRAYAGYAGWSPGQLEREVARGDWIVMRGDPDLVFLADPEALWPKLISAHSGLQASLGMPDAVGRFEQRARWSAKQWCANRSLRSARRSTRSC